jgi:hypothetical protein
MLTMTMANKGSVCRLLREAYDEMPGTFIPVYLVDDEEVSAE